MRGDYYIALLAGVLAIGGYEASAEVLVPKNGILSKAGESRRLVAFQPSALITSDKRVKRASRAAPKSDILAAIENAANKHSNNSAIQSVGLSLDEWHALFQANIEIESGYNPFAKSIVGAFGLGQLMPDTAKSLGVNMYQMDENLDGSARYLLLMLDKFQKIDLALAAYNAGPGAVEKYNGVPPYAETRGHVEKVTRVYNRIKG